MCVHVCVHPVLQSQLPSCCGFRITYSVCAVVLEKLCNWILNCKPVALFRLPGREHQKIIKSKIRQTPRQSRFLSSKTVKESCESFLTSFFGSCVAAARLSADRSTPMWKYFHWHSAGYEPLIVNQQYLSACFTHRKVENSIKFHSCCWPSTPIQWHRDTSSQVG